MKIVPLLVGAVGLLALACGQEDADPSIMNVPDGILRIRTVDTDGQPVTGAAVRIDGATENLLGDAYGQTPVDVPLQPGSYRATVELTDYIVTPVEVTTRVLGTRTTTLQFTLEPGTPPPARVDVSATVATGTGDEPVTGLGILVDDVLVPEVTPATLEVSPGDHRIALADSLGLHATSAAEVTVSVVSGETEPASFTYVPGFSRIVLVEDFTNTGCGPCPPAEEALLRVASGYSLGALVTMHVHTLQPSPLDPMYWANDVELGGRFSYYALSGDPTFILDGNTVLFPTPPEAELADSIAAHSGAIAQVYLTVDFTINGNEVSTHATVRSLEDLPGDYRLLVITLQKLIDYATPPGTNGQRTFVRTARDFLPDGDGEPVALTAGAVLTFDLSAPLLDASHQLANPPDDPAQVACLAILQEWTTREIIQVASTLD